MFMNFKCTPENRAHLKTIIDRIAEFDPDRDRRSTEMDLIACHNGGCPLDFAAMAAWEDFFHVAHDIAGIGSYLDRETGKLAGFFRPRFALPETPRPGEKVSYTTVKMNQPYRPAKPEKPAKAEKPLALPKPKKGSIQCICEHSYVAPRETCAHCGRAFSESHNRTHGDAIQSKPQLRIL